MFFFSSTVKRYRVFSDRLDTVFQFKNVFHLKVNRKGFISFPEMPGFNTGIGIRNLSSITIMQLNYTRREEIILFFIIIIWKYEKTLMLLSWRTLLLMFLPTLTKHWYIHENRILFFNYLSFQILSIAINPKRDILSWPCWREVILVRAIFTESM